MLIMASIFLERFKNRIQKLNKRGDIKLTQLFPVLPPIDDKKLHFDNKTPTNFIYRLHEQSPPRLKRKETRSKVGTPILLSHYSNQRTFTKKLFSSSAPRIKNAIKTPSPVPISKKPILRYLSPGSFKRYDSINSRS